ncbi:dephospho-CoA kinase [Acididesulfobacillus acetoxydans]|uniref:Dephospho-CoA kinase n=1 Tax=Acididesulfobacillus acetoxydans TaxID=1561005 RepID=A0A8S0W443_9FIRM|nr:dephospho-CoA kinase [Acididesulfobacillus acetoxydans]CAA7602228.1 dephospho-CoA kinase [Acididesulfobacillus acetoxydans]CEJ07554.1 Dephospho-CoA kinase [Acididesulfobacillus acetoxydans]
MWLIGLTGGIGSGKSSVARWLREHGIPVLDADAMVRRLLQGDAETVTMIRQAFGPKVIAEDGQVERRKLARVVFADVQAREALEGIVYPRIERLRLEEMRTLEDCGHRLAIWDVPLLFEKNLRGNVQETLLIWVPVEVQIERVRRRDGWTRADILARLAAQMPLDDKRKLADVMIDNSGDWSETENQLVEYWRTLAERGLVTTGPLP